MVSDEKNMIRMSILNGTHKRNSVGGTGLGGSILRKTILRDNNQQQYPQQQLGATDFRPRISISEFDQLYF